jgi:hypothetical protein
VDGIGPLWAELAGHDEQDGAAALARVAASAHDDVDRALAERDDAEDPAVATSVAVKGDTGPYGPARAAAGDAAGRADLVGGGRRCSP